MPPRDPNSPALTDSSRPSSSDSTNLASPSPDALSDYDLSSTHLVVSAKDPNLNPAWHTRKGIYLIKRGKQGQVKELTSGSQGATSSPRFSPDGKSVVWLEMEEDQYEAVSRSASSSRVKPDTDICLLILVSRTATASCCTTLPRTKDITSPRAGVSLLT